MGFIYLFSVCIPYSSNVPIVLNGNSASSGVCYLSGFAHIQIYIKHTCMHRHTVDYFFFQLLCTPTSFWHADYNPCIQIHKYKPQHTHRHLHTTKTARPVQLTTNAKHWIYKSPTQKLAQRHSCAMWRRSPSSVKSWSSKRKCVRITFIGFFLCVFYFALILRSIFTFHFWTLKWNYNLEPSDIQYSGQFCHKYMKFI